jgi:hypothetical protein
MAGILGNPNNQSQDNPNLGPGYIIGRVKDIVLGPIKHGELNIKDDNFTGYGDIGKITYDILYSPTILSMGGVSKSAYPMFSFIKHLPVIHEIVYIVPGPSPDMNDDMANRKLYYMPAYSTWNAVNHNAFPNLDEFAQYMNNQKSKGNYNSSKTTVQYEMPKGYTFGENDVVRPLTPFEGDTIIESRFGQSIRFGSTIPAMSKYNHWSDSGKNGDPITIIRNGQGIPTNPNDKFATTVEDINSDDSSIYLTSGQKIMIDSIINYPLNSFDKVEYTTEYQNVITSYYHSPMSNEMIDAVAQDEIALKYPNKTIQ